MAYDFGRAFQQLFTGGNIDTRAPEAIMAAQRGQQMAGALQQEYANASQNPNYGIGTPEQQAYQERELERSVRNRAGAGGAGGSGFEGDQVRKAMVDFRISQIANRQKALNDLRTAQVQANMQGWPQPMTYQPGAINQGLGALMGQGIRTLGEDVFGKTNEQRRKDLADAQDAGNPGGGFRVAPPGQPGGQSGGPGNYSPFSLGWQGRIS